MINDWKQFFPFSKPRDEQIKAVEFALETFNSNNKPYVIIDAPTGIGKSAVAVTLARYFQSHPTSNDMSAAYILTTQKILQEQYKQDFPYLANISAKQNYICEHRAGGLTCDFGLTIQKALMKTDFNKYYGNCVYARAKKAFDTSDIGVTNLHFFMSHANPNRTDIKNRSLIVVDEAHNLENLVVSFATLQFTKYAVMEILKLSWPSVNKMKITEFVEWVKTTYAAKLEKEYLSLKLRIEQSQSESFLTSNSGISLMKKADELNRQIESLDRCLDKFEPKEWVMSVSPTEDIVDIAPLYAKHYTQPLIFGFAKKILLMSGTILDKKTYCRNTGIPEGEAEFLSLDSPFPIKNRPIFMVNVGSLSRNNIKETLPNVIHVIKELMDEHKDEKGIIHTHTYQISKYIEDNIKSDRLLFHSSDDRQDIYNMHMINKGPTILVSPSMTEGIDLIDDLARFAIIVKCAYPYLGDNYIRTKMEKVKGWYEWNTAKTLIQASGRTVRHTEDYCVTYVLDSDASWFIDKNMYLFPNWWIKAITK